MLQWGHRQDTEDLVCHCGGVSRSQITEAIATGRASTLESLGAQLGCGLRCACCRPLVQELLGHSPWYYVTKSTRTTLTGDRDSDRRIVQIDMQLAGFPLYPQTLPSQNVVVQAWLNETWVTRTYTVICQSEDGNTISIAMRRVPSGQLSPRLLDADDATFAAIPMRISAPNGEADPVDGRPVVCFVAGVGVTLAVSLLHGARRDRTLHIDYSAIHRGDMAYVDWIESSAGSNRNITCQLRVDDVDGLIDDDHILETVNQFPGARFYVCGPKGYTRRVVDGLRIAQVPEADVRVELFFIKPPARPQPNIRRLPYVTGLVVAFLPLILLMPTLSNFVPNNSYGPGHEDLACSDCHLKAPGTIRQQLQAKAKHLLGLRDSSADFGMREVDSPSCTRCHQNPNDRHPTHRFFEPRFAQARRELGPQTCVNCHREHTGGRLSQTNTGFCSSCHGDLAIKNDPTRPTHEALAHDRRWETCLTCHDFHGNHTHTPPTDLQNAITPAAVVAYLRRAQSPYGERVIKAKLREVLP